MRFKSKPQGGLQVFAVSGTNVVSFGIKADQAALDGVLGFSIKRFDHQTNERGWVEGYKVFRSVVPNPTPTTKVLTRDHPIQSLIWDDFYVVPGGTYDYEFYPFKGTPQTPDLTTPPVTISTTTEPLSAGDHDIFFNRGVTGSQSYAIHFKNKPPDKQPTEQKRKEAFEWLSRNLDEELIGFIESADTGDAIRGCFYEFSFDPVLDAFKKAIDKGVDVKLIIDEKVNEHTLKANPAKGRPHDVFVESTPRVKNLAAIAKAGLPDSAITPRVARKDDIQHNKFMVLLKGAARTPTAVWTGSTNITTGGIYGQANVGHLVRDTNTAGQFLAYWNILADDPGAKTDAKTDPVNIAFLSEVDGLTPTPTTVDDIPHGVTPIFSPRGNLKPLDLYQTLLANPAAMSCGTFPFGITRTWRKPLADSGASGRLCFLLLDKVDRVKPTKSDPGPVVLLNSTSNIYKAYGSEIETALGKWVIETNNIKLNLNEFVSYIHLKFILHDPLGPDPIVVTGSANFSDASTTENDENMIIIRGDRRVADIYFTEFNRLWGHYYYRSVVEQTKKDKPPPGPGKPHNYQDLWESTDWQRDYAPGKLRAKRVQQYIQMSI
jgi:phosphatidylserine/phosphatidylglycerophosphate/cardiolipin synthase-like enzyme